MAGEQARFVFLGQSAAGRRMTAEDELELNSRLNQVAQVRWRCGRHCLERAIIIYTELAKIPAMGFDWSKAA